MKTIDLATNPMSADDLLASAREGSVLVRSASGEAFVVSEADDFATEAELLRCNHRFLTLLDSWKADPTSISLDDVEDRLR
jgi:hypothetical protein